MLKANLVFLLFLSGCTNGPQTETSEEKLVEQAKIIQQAADDMVNTSVSKFDISETDANENPSTTNTAVQADKL